MRRRALATHLLKLELKAPDVEDPPTQAVAVELQPDSNEGVFSSESQYVIYTPIF